MSSTLNNLFIGVLTFLFGISAAANPISSKIETPSALIESLKLGGYIIYMRHGITIRKSAQRNKEAIDFTKCGTQRNLSLAGITQLAKIGQAIKALNIPIDSVKSSPYCRTKDTASTVFGTFEVDNNLRFSIAMDNKESAMLGQYLLEAMLATDSAHANAVFVGHTANLKDGLGVWPQPEGVMVIFKKQDDSLIYKGMIKPDDWPPLN